MFALKCFIILNYFVASVFTTMSWSKDDNMGQADKDKLVWLSRELVTEAKLYMRQINEIVDAYRPMMSFEVGVIIGKIREKLKLMMEAYRQSIDHFTGKNKMAGPGIQTLRPLHFIVTMEKIHAWEVDIDKFISVLENIPSSRWDENPHIANPDGNFKSKTKTDKTALRQGPDEDMSTNKTQSTLESHSKAMLERQLKSKYREQFLMRRLGKPENLTTTRKRFRNNWPVESTWSLEEYSQA